MSGDDALLVLVVGACSQLVAEAMRVVIVHVLVREVAAVFFFTKAESIDFLLFLINDCQICSFLSTSTAVMNF